MIDRKKAILLTDKALTKGNGKTTIDNYINDHLETIVNQIIEDRAKAGLDYVMISSILTYFFEQANNRKLNRSYFFIATYTKLIKLLSVANFTLEIDDLAQNAIKLDKDSLLNEIQISWR